MNLWEELPKKTILISSAIALVVLNLFAFIISKTLPDMGTSLAFILAASVIAFFLSLFTKFLLGTPKRILMFAISVILIALIVIIVIMIFPDVILASETLVQPFQSFLRGGT